MSFIMDGRQGAIYAPGWFLVNNEDCSRFTKTIPQSLATTAADGTKYVKMGTLYTTTEEVEVEGTATEVTNYIGFVYEDVDVTSGDMPGSVVTKGEVYVDRLPAELTEAARTALEARGFVFVETAPTVIRPY